MNKLVLMLLYFYEKMFSLILLMFFKITQNLVNFNYSSSFDPTDISVYSYYSSTSNPMFYVLKKQVKAISGQVKTQNFAFSKAQQFSRVILSENDMIQII